jgi:hypothetical protein
MTMGISRVAYGGRREPGDDYIDLEVHQLGGELGKPADLSLRREIRIECFVPRHSRDCAIPDETRAKTLPD